MTGAQGARWKFASLQDARQFHADKFFSEQLEKAVPELKAECVRFAANGGDWQQGSDVFFSLPFSPSASFPNALDLKMDVHFDPSHNTLRHFPLLL